MIKSLFLALIFIIINSFSIIENNKSELTLQLDKLILPEGFKIEVYASDIENARSFWSMWN